MIREFLDMLRDNPLGTIVELAVLVFVLLGLTVGLMGLSIAGMGVAS